MSNTLTEIDQAASLIGLIDGDVKSVELGAREGRSLASAISNCYRQPILAEKYVLRTDIFKTGVTVAFSGKKTGITFKLKVTDLVL